MVVLALVAGIGGIGTARADHAPAIVVPGNPDVPVIINGQNAAGAVVVGDWGLYRPGHLAPTVIYRRPWPAPRHYRYYHDWRHRHHHRRPATVRPCRCKRVKPVRRKVIVKPGRRHFYPGGTLPPKLGRHELDGPASPPPVPAESFSRTWSSSSSRAPATIGQPAVVVAPAIVGNRFRPKPKPKPPKPGP